LPFEGTREQKSMSPMVGPERSVIVIILSPATTPSLSAARWPHWSWDLLHFVRRVLKFPGLVLTQ
jgi:hypothetical protein